MSIMSFTTALPTLVFSEAVHALHCRVRNAAHAAARTVHAARSTVCPHPLHCSVHE